MSPHVRKTRATQLRAKTQREKFEIFQSNKSHKQLFGTRYSSALDNRAFCRKLVQEGRAIEKWVKRKCGSVAVFHSTGQQWPVRLRRRWPPKWGGGAGGNSLGMFRMVTVRIPARVPLLMSHESLCYVLDGASDLSGSLYLAFSSFRRSAVRKTMWAFLFS